MKYQNFIISKHVLHRVIERIIKSQNIKLNKNQIKANSKKARKVIYSDLENSFAMAFNEKDDCFYYYVGLKDSGLCLKYVVDNKSKCIITLIKDVVFSNEILRYDVKIIDKVLKIVSKKEFILCSYIRTIFDNNQYLMVVNNKSKKISSIALEDGGCVC